MPTCSICGARLEYTPEGWQCPIDKFYFNVSRGVAGEPLLNPPRQLEVSQEQQTHQAAAAKEETFEEWLAKRGVTKEMYEGENKETKEDLKTAFYHRGQKDADVVLLPPR